MPNKNNSTGFTIIEVLVSFALALIGVYGILTLSSNQQKNISFTAGSQAIQFLRFQLEKTLGDQAALNLTRTANSNFKNCFPTTKQVSAVSTTCDSGIKDLELFNVENTKIAGTRSSPVHYNADGEICTTLGGDCIYDVYAEYWARCPSSASTCAVTSGLAVRYGIKLAPGQTPNGGIRLKDIESVFIPLTVQPRYIFTNSNNKIAEWTTTFLGNDSGPNRELGYTNFGKHHACFITASTGDMEGCGDCFIHGGERGSFRWWMNGCDEGDAQTHTCSAACVDF